MRIQYFILCRKRREAFASLLLLPCSNGIRLLEATEVGGHNKLLGIHGGGGRSGFYEARAVRSNALDAA